MPLRSKGGGRCRKIGSPSRGEQRTRRLLVVQGLGG